MTLSVLRGQLDDQGPELVMGEHSRDRSVSIGLSGDQIMQRYLVRRIFRESEFRFEMVNGSVREGFVTGFDADFLQVSTADDPPRALLLRRSAVAEIGETGKRLADKPPALQERIRQYSSALRSACERSLGVRGSAIVYEPPS